jgi:hypothetical protein
MQLLGYFVSSGTPRLTITSMRGDMERDGLISDFKID